MNFFESCATLIDNQNFDEYKGVNSYRLLYSQTSDVVPYVILPTQQFRPDKICSILYDDPTLSWVLDDLNNFKHGIKEYLPGITILTFKRQTLIRNGIISK